MDPRYFLLKLNPIFFLSKIMSIAEIVLDPYREEKTINTKIYKGKTNDRSCISIVAKKKTKKEKERVYLAICL